MNRSTNDGDNDDGENENGDHTIAAEEYKHRFHAGGVQRVQPLYADHKVW